ncbi:MAG: hypothetical protein STSR0001_01430 [Methanothrix sp.]
MRRTDMQMVFVLMLLSCLSIQAIALDPGTIAVPSITGANMDMPKPLITPPSMDMANSPTKVTVVEGKRDPFSDGSPFNETETSEADKVNGDWTVRFADRSDVSLGLTLWASGGSKVMGFGELRESQAKNSVSASGSFEGELLMLKVKSAAPKFQGQRYDGCDLDLVLANETLFGSYILKWNGEILDEGNATAVRI